MDKKWILGLDSLRIILAVIVLLSHLDIYSVLHIYNGPYIEILIAIIGNAFVGICAVIAFFVISGIVIHFPYTHQKKMNTLSFLMKRLTRIGFPMLIVYIISKFINMPISKLPFWSLYCELIYYTIYPILLYFIRLNNKVLILSYICSFFISYLIIFLNGNALHDLMIQNKNFSAEYWQFGILLTAFIGLPNWLLGLLIAKRYSVIKSINVSIKRIYIIRIFILVISMVCSIARFHFSLSYTLSLNVFGILSAYWIWNEINYWAKRNPNKLLEFLGKISYSVYICHAIAVFLVAGFLDSSFLTLGVEIIATFVFSFVFYLLVEKPSHQLAQKLLKF